MISWLRKKAEEAVAQINPFDGGKTAQTVRQARPAQPAVTQRAPAPSYGGGLTGVVNRARDVVDANTTQDRYKRVIQNRPEIDKTYQDDIRNNLNQVKNTALGVKNTVDKNLTNVVNVARDQVDANTQTDRTRRLSTAQPEMYADQQRAKGIGERSINNNVAQRGVNFTRAAAEGMASGPLALGRGIGNSAAMLSGDYKRAQESEKINRDVTRQVEATMWKTLNDPYANQAQRDHATKVLNQQAPQGMENLRTKIASENDPRRIAAAAADTALTVGTAGLAGATKQGVNAAYKGAKATQLATGATVKQATNAGVKAGVKNFGINTAKTALTGAGAGFASSYTVDPNATLKQGLTGAVQGGVGGAVLPAAFMGPSYIKPTIKAGAQQVPKIVNKAGQSIDDVFDGVRQAYGGVNKQGSANPFRQVATPEGIKMPMGGVDTPSVRSDYVVDMPGGGQKSVADTYLTKVPEDKLYNAAKKELQKRQGQTITFPDGRTAKINSRTINELLQGKRLDEFGPEEYSDFLRSLGNLDEHVAISGKARYVKNLKDKPPEFQKKGFDNRDVNYSVNGRDRRNDMQVAKGESQDILYQYVKSKINKNNHLRGGVTDKSAPTYINLGDYTSNIPQNPQHVNPIKGLEELKKIIKKQDGFVANPLNKGGDVAKSAPIEKTPTRTQAINKVTVAASEAPELKTPNDLLPNGVDETLAKIDAQNKLMLAKSEAPRLTNPTVTAIEEAGAKLNGGVQSKRQLQKPTLKQPNQRTDAKTPVGTAQSTKAQLAEPKISNKSSYTNDTTMGKQAYKDTFNVSDAEATKDLANLNNSSKKQVGNLTKKDLEVIETISGDNAITKAAREAQQSGKEFNFYGKMDKNGRSIGVEQFNPKTHRIEAGFVVDSDGVQLGNHIKINETGTSVNIGGKYTNMDEVFGDITKWKSQNKWSSTIERNIMEAAPDKDTGRKAVNWLVGDKRKAERAWKEAIGSSVAKNDSRYKAVMKGKPLGTSKKQVLSDAMDYGEAKLSKADLTAKYGDDYAKTITDSIDGMRADYDKYIKDINDTRVRFGLEPIETRKDYITHISELNTNKNFVGDMTTSLKNSITGEAMERTRGGVPADISGRTEGFTPSTKWNQYLQRRKGGKYEKDPFKAFNEYVPNAEHNIHMTESVVKARSAEEFLRARTNLAGLDAKNYGKLLSDELGQKVKGGPQDDKLVSLFQEYANSLAGKTQKTDRAILDSPLQPALKGWQGLQRIGGRATILGNISSVLMQPLNQVNVFATTSTKSYAKGMAKWLSADDVIKQSDFVQARIKHIDSVLRGKGQKFQDAAGVPLRAVEEQSVKLAWYANHADALKKGLKGKQAILEADRMTERSVAGRGLADKPELYRSTAFNGLLQYTLEVMAQAKVFWKDLTPVQKAKWMVGASAMNTGMALIINERPLPDYINAVVEGTGALKPEDDRDAKDKAIDTGQGIISETVKFNPIAANAAQYLPKDIKSKIFGSDSNLTRFDGNAAPLRVVENAYKAGQAAFSGNSQEAISRGLRLVPTGNQIQKTLNSVAMNARGYHVDKNGKRTFDAPTSPADKARSYLFGPHSTDAAKAYYGDDAAKKAAKADTKKDKAKSGPLAYDQAIDIQKKEYGGKYADYTESEIKELAKTDGEAKQYLGSLEATKKAFGSPKEVPEGLHPSVAKIYQTEDRLTDEGKAKWKNKASNDQYVKDTLKNWNNGEEVPVTNEIAKMWADYEKKRLEGKISNLEMNKEKKAVLRKAYSSVLNEDEKGYYNVSDKDIISGLEQGLVTQESLKKAMDIDALLVSKGLIASSGFGKTVWNALGLNAPKSPTAKTTSSRTSRVKSTKVKTSKAKTGKTAKGGKYNYNLFMFGDAPTKSKSLRDLVNKASAKA